MLADGYDNGYVKCITSNADNVFFVTIDWEGNLRLNKCDYKGDNLTIIYTEKTNVRDPMSDIDMYMICDDGGLYITFGERIGYYDFDSNTLIDIYNTTGYIKDICKIDNNIFFIDDLEEKSRILYTEDFDTFNDLMDYNTLTNEFTKYGKDGTFNWHFKEISGNNFNNIYLSFSSLVNEYDEEE